MKRLLLLLLAILLFSVQAYAETFYLGASLPLSGASAAEGKAMQLGIQAYLNKVNSEKLLGPNDRIELLVEDDKNNKDEAKIAVTKLGKNPAVLGVIGHLYSSVALGAASAYKENGLVGISPSASNAAVTQDSKWQFSMAYNDLEQGANIAVYLNVALKARRILIIRGDNAYSAGLSDAFIARSSDLGLDVETLRFKSEGEDFDQLIEQHFAKKDSNYDAIFSASHFHHGIHITNALRAVGVDQPIIGPDSHSKVKYIAGLGANTKNVLVASPFLFELASLKVLDYTNEFKRVNKQDPTLWSIFSYDAAVLLTEAGWPRQDQD